MPEIVKDVAATSGVTQADTDRILSVYSNLVVHWVKSSGYTVPYLGIAELTSSEDGFVRGMMNQPTLATQVAITAQESGYPFHVVESAMNSYRETVIDQLIEKKHVNIYRVVTLRLTEDLRLRSNSSEVFKDRFGFSVRSAIVGTFKRQFEERLRSMGLILDLSF